MAIELPKELRAEAVASLERYFNENFEERIGNIAAGALLNFFIEEVGPTIYNKAVADVQERLAARVQKSISRFTKTSFSTGVGKANLEPRRAVESAA